MISEQTVRMAALAGASAVAIVGLLQGQDGMVLAAFFGFLAGLGLSKTAQATVTTS